MFKIGDRVQIDRMPVIMVVVDIDLNGTIVQCRCFWFDANRGPQYAILPMSILVKA